MDDNFRDKFIFETIIPKLEKILEKTRNMVTKSGNDYIYLIHSTMDGRYHKKKDDSSFAIYMYRDINKSGFLASDRYPCSIYGIALFLYKELKGQIDIKDMETSFEKKLKIKLDEHCERIINEQFEN